MGGSKKSEQLQRLAEEPGRLVANSRFLGRVEVPLSETLSLKRGRHPLRISSSPPPHAPEFKLALISARVLGDRADQRALSVEGPVR